jgi:excisionase family DNA binding protein
MTTTTQNPGDRYVSLPKAAAMLGVSERTMRRIADENGIAFITPNVHRRFRERDVIAYRERRATAAAASAAEPETENALAD